MAAMFARLILEGRKTLNDVPAFLKPQVESILRQNKEWVLANTPVTNEPVAE